MCQVAENGSFVCISPVSPRISGKAAKILFLFCYDFSRSIMLYYFCIKIDFL